MRKAVSIWTQHLVSLLPPDLTIFCDLELYLRWFTWQRNPKAEINALLHTSHWIDGAGRCVKIRQAHVRDATEYILRLTTSADDSVRSVAQDLYVYIFRLFSTVQTQVIYQRFLYTSFLLWANSSQNLTYTVLPTW